MMSGIRTIGLFLTESVQPRFARMSDLMHNSTATPTIEESGENGKWIPTVLRTPYSVRITVSGCKSRSSDSDGGRDYDIEEISESERRKQVKRNSITSMRLRLPTRDLLMD